MSKEILKNKNHTSHFTPHTSNRGITLLSLILTVIIMLILTGVALSIALGENGIVEKAKEATTQTQVAMDRELLLSAAIGAMGNDGKVNLSAMVLPEGFTGSNGTYTSSNGNTFTVSEMGDIVFTGGSDSDEGTVALDLNGKYCYYEALDSMDDYFEIVDNSKFRYVSYSSSSDKTDIQETPIVSIDEENKTFEVRFYEDMNNLDEYQSMIVPYTLIEENGKIVNKLIIFDEEIFLQNKNGLKYDLSGTYMNAEGDYRLTFKNDGTLEGQYKDANGNWTGGSGDSFKLYSYYRANEIYYSTWNGFFEVSDDKNTITFTYVGEVFTKQSN